MTARRALAIPDKAAIAELPLFERLTMKSITLVRTSNEAKNAHAELVRVGALGFDTESKPTFKVGETSDGPHVLQLATAEQAWVIQLHDRDCREVVADLMALPHIVKAGFGLGDDQKRIVQNLGVVPASVVELNTLFRQRGYRKDMGVKAAVAVLFGQRFIKSKKASTSNWANEHLSETQLIYAANDAYAAYKVWAALAQCA